MFKISFVWFICKSTVQTIIGFNQSTKYGNISVSAVNLSVKFVGMGRGLIAIKKQMNESIPKSLFSHELSTMSSLR